MNNKTVNERFKGLRINLKLNQRDFADKLGVTQAIISYVETGGKPSYDVMEGIFTGIKNINFTWLLSGEGEMFVSDEVNEDIGELQEKNKVFEEEIKNLKNKEIGRASCRERV